MTPSGPDAFTLSYSLYGENGSQPMAALGRGCPTLDGSAVDVSTQWFDPAKAGTGYSVQMWPGAGYEYFAAFVYDAQGVPMFLAAENGTFGGEESTLVLQRLTGSCPTCSHGTTSRTDVGTFVRRMSGGALAGIEIDAVWQEAAPFAATPSAWSATDAVQALGGPGTTQGCAP